jgi:hypothetical protein
MMGEDRLDAVHEINGREGEGKRKKKKKRNKKLKQR